MTNEKTNITSNFLNSLWITFFYKYYYKTFLLSSFKILKKNSLAIVRVNLFVIAIFILNTYVSALLSMHLSYIRENQNFVLYVFAIPVFSYFLAGTINYYMGLLKKRTVSVFQIFSGYRWFFGLFLYNSLIYLLFMIFCYVATSFFQYGLIVKIRIIFGLLFFVWFLLRSAFTIPLIIEFSLSLRQSLHISFQLSRGRFWEMFLFFFIALFIALSGIAFLGIGFFLSVGFFVLAALSLFYSLTKNEPKLYKPDNFILETNNSKTKKNS